MAESGAIQINKGQDDIWVPTQCWMCISGPCSIEVHRINGVAVNIRGNRSVLHYFTRTRNRGTICPKTFGLIQKHYSPHRLYKPLKRTNPEKGIGVDPRWVEIEWDEAFKIVGEKFASSREKGIYTSWGISGFGKWGGLFPLLGCFANTEELHAGSLKCGMADHNFANLIHGAFNVGPDLDYCNYLLILGSNPSASFGASGVQGSANW